MPGNKIFTNLKMQIMKKILLLAFALTIAMTGMAQRKLTPGLKKVLIDKNYYGAPIDKGVAAGNLVTDIPPVSPKSTSALSQVFVGASINVFGVLYEIQTVLWYEDALNAILFTCRGNQAGSIGVLATGNDINTFISTDKGDTWNGQTTLTRPGKYHRYPSGVFYNPDGNNDPANAFTIASGPRTDGSGWINNYHSSADATATDTSVVYIPNEIGENVMDGMSSSTNGLITVSGSWYTGDYLSHMVYFHHGFFNTSTNKVDWEVTPIEMGNYVLKNSDSTLNSFLGWANSNMSRDGSVGYILVRGVDKQNTVHPSYAQVLIKTTDGGQTWEHVPFFDLSTLPTFRDHILPTAADTSLHVPVFSLTASTTSNKFEADIIVDGYGKPHIFAEVRGAVSTNLDSLGYVWVGPDDLPIDNNIYEIYQDQFDQWHAIWIDSLVTDNLLDENSTWSGTTSGSIGWTHRIQGSQTPDGKITFATWTDTDWQTYASDRLDRYPDLKIWGHNLDSYYNTAVKNVSKDDPDLAGAMFFHYTSPYSWVDGNTINIPVTREDILYNNSPDLPVFHYFIKGVTLDMSEFVLGGAPSPSAIGASSVSGCYPNPFSGTTTVQIILAKSASVNIEINSLMGQKVSSTNYGVLSTGTHNLTIDGSSLASGVYFYTVTAGDYRSTNKMIVR